MAKASKKDTNKTLSIAVVMQSPDLGGAETYMLSLVDHFLNDGSKICIVSNRGKFFDQAKKRKVKMHIIPIIFDIMGNYRGLIKSIAYLPYLIYFYVNLLIQFKKKGVNIIVMSGFSEKLLVTWIASFFAIPVVWIEYGPLKIVFSRLLSIPKIAYLLAKHLPQAVIVPTKNTMNSLIIDAKVSRAKLHVIPCGTDVIKKHKNVKAALIPQFNNNIVIGNVSRQTIEKGQDVLIRSMPYILKKVSSARLFIVGDGPDLSYYRQLVVDLKIEKYVHFTGYVKDTNRYYDCMDMFVFPTVWALEGFGVVLVEAMMHKLPIIGSNMGPVPEIIDDKQIGVLFKTRDEKALAKVVITLCNSKEKRMQLAENGYQKALKKYDIIKISKRIQEILRIAAYANRG